MNNKYLEKVLKKSLTKIYEAYSETIPGGVREHTFKGIAGRMSGETLKLRQRLLENSNEKLLEKFL